MTVKKASKAPSKSAPKAARKAAPKAPAKGAPKATAKAAAKPAPKAPATPAKPVGKAPPAAGGKTPAKPGPLSSMGAPTKASRADSEPAPMPKLEKLADGVLCQIEVLKDGHFFIARTQTESGQAKEFKNTVFEDLLTEMLITLQEQLAD